MKNFKIVDHPRNASKFDFFVFLLNQFKTKQKFTLHRFGIVKSHEIFQNI